MKHKPQTLIFLGRSGAGKGTQVAQLERWLEAQHPADRLLYITTGDEFRRLAATESYTAGILRERLERGDLQPSFLPTWAWANILIAKLQGDEHLFFDGTPRMLGEALMLDGALEFYQRSNVKVINLMVSREAARERLLARGRVDDNEAALDRRLSWYESDVVPVLDHMRQSPLYTVIDIDGERSIEAIHQDIITHL